MSRLLDFAERVFRRAPRVSTPVFDRDLPVSSTFVALRRYWIDPLDRR